MAGPYGTNPETLVPRGSARLGRYPDVGHGPMGRTRQGPKLPSSGPCQILGFGSWRQPSSPQFQLGADTDRLSVTRRGGGAGASERLSLSAPGFNLGCEARTNP